MHEPILKLHWERLTTQVEVDGEIAKKLLLPFTHDVIADVRLLSESCANSNYKVRFHTSRPPVVLRIYVREKSALKREIALHNLVLETGDAWEGQTLNRETYGERVLYSRTAFPDLIFKIEKIVAENNLVAVIWSAEGTHRADLIGLAATGKRVSFNGQTFYEIKNDLV